MSELLRQDRAALQAALEAALPDEKLEPLKKKVRGLTQEIVDEIEWSLKSDLAENLSHYVKEMAERAVTALLEGNEAEMIRWLGCDTRGFNGRSDGYNSNRSIEDQHSVIHGKLFETGSVLLRKKIAQAHRDIITAERIKDLEDQVASLVAQNNKLGRERDEWRERAVQ